MRFDGARLMNESDFVVPPGESPDWPQHEYEGAEGNTCSLRCTMRTGAEWRCSQYADHPVHAKDEPPPVSPLPPQTLEQWWRTLTESDIEATTPKIGEYSATDLIAMGDVLRQWTETESMPQRWGVEQAIVFYLLGKVARAVGAYREGRSPSDDTLKDIRIYAVMLQRVRDAGGWPA